MTVAHSIVELIGKTPVVKLNRSADDQSADIYLKLEYQNPGSSVKDRIALAMIEAAEKDGRLKEGDTIIEATSGNTGIGIALVATAKGYNTVLVMPETMSLERRNLLKAYGAELVLTPGSEGMNGAVAKAEALAAEHGYFVAEQFKNIANPEVHRRTTGQEIINDFPDGIDAFVAGIGTGGTITGAGNLLKETFPGVKIVAVEPKDSPILKTGKPGPHKLQGLGANFVPEILDTDVYDEIIHVSTEQAFEHARETARKEGILGGISSGAAVYAAKQVARELGPGKKVVAILPSNGERYLSTALYQFEEEETTSTP